MIIVMVVCFFIFVNKNLSKKILAHKNLGRNINIKRSRGFLRQCDAVQQLNFLVKWVSETVKRFFAIVQNDGKGVGSNFIRGMPM